jgi:hypothetical protein
MEYVLLAVCFTLLLPICISCGLLLGAVLKPHAVSGA